MVRRKDRFWEYVVELKDGFRCNFCGREFHGGIPRIKSHLSRVRCRGIDICEKVPEDVRVIALSEITGPCKKFKTTVTSNDHDANQTSSASTDNLSKIIEKGRSMVDKKLVKFIMLNNIPFDVVEEQSFADLLNSVSEFGPDYKLPSTRALRAKLIPEVEMDIKAYLKNVRESWDKTGCTIKVDSIKSFISVLASSPRGLVFVNLYDLSKSNTSLRDLVSLVIDDIGADRVVQLITKDDEMLCEFKDLLVHKYPPLYMISCVAHEIHKFLYCIYYNVSWVQAIIDDAELIVKYMYKDASILSMMRRHTKNRELKHGTGGNKFSHYQMLQSVFDNRHELSQLVSSAEWKALDCNNTDSAVKVADIIQRKEFWSQGEEVLKTLEPIIQVLRLVEDERATSGYLYEAMVKAKDVILQLYKNDKNKYARVVEIFEEEENAIIHPIHAAAAFLNPAYMCRMSFKDDAKMKKGILFLHNTLVSDGERKGFMIEVQLYRNKMSDLFTEMTMQMLEQYHPWVWWDYYGDCLPVLRKYAIRILSQCCKCSCELKYTAIEVAYTMQDSLLFETMNTMMMEKFKSLETQCLESIDLQNCNELPDYVDLYQAKPFLFLCSGEKDSAADCAIEEQNKLLCNREKDSAKLKKAVVSWTKIRCVSKWFWVRKQAEVHRLEREQLRKSEEAAWEEVQREERQRMYDVTLEEVLRYRKMQDLTWEEIKREVDELLTEKQLRGNGISYLSDAEPDEFSEHTEKKRKEIRFRKSIRKLKKL